MQLINYPKLSGSKLLILGAPDDAYAGAAFSNFLLPNATLIGNRIMFGLFSSLSGESFIH